MNEMEKMEKAVTVYNYISAFALASTAHKPSPTFFKDPIFITSHVLLKHKCIIDLKCTLFKANEHIIKPFGFKNLVVQSNHASLHLASL
jgi:hypothetical protein